MVCDGGCSAHDSPLLPSQNRRRFLAKVYVGHTRHVINACRVISIGAKENHAGQKTADALRCWKDAQVEGGARAVQESQSRADCLERLVRAEADARTIALYDQMIAMVRALRTPTCTTALLAYEEAVGQLVLRRAGIEGPLSDTTAFQMARNARPLNSKEPSLSQIKRLAREADCVRH